MQVEAAIELDLARWKEIFQALEEAGPVRVLVSNATATMETVGCFAGFSLTGDYFNVQSDSLDLHIRWRELSHAYAVQKPGHVDGHMTHSFQFFDRDGTAAMKVFFTFGEPTPSAARERFFQLLATFRTRP
jgi:putative hemin transport protein